MKLNEEGEFAFYSGAAIQNANNEILFHKNKLFKTTNNEIHATVNSRNGYLHIDNLTADEIGIIYTDYGFVDIYQFQDWIEDRIRDDQWYEIAIYIDTNEIKQFQNRLLHFIIGFLFIQNKIK